MMEAPGQPTTALQATLDPPKGWSTKPPTMAVIPEPRLLKGTVTPTGTVWERATPGPAWDAESEAIDAEIAADREEALSPGHVNALHRADVAEDLYCNTATELMEVSAVRDRLMAENERIAAQRAFLLAHSAKLIDRLAGAKMLSGDLTSESASQFVNAERQGVNAVMEQIGAAT